MDPFIKNSSGSYYKVSSDLKYQSYIPRHRQIDEYLQKEKDIKQFELNESPLHKAVDDYQLMKINRVDDINIADDMNRVEGTNRVDDSLEYRSFMPSQDFIFSHSKKNSEVKDIPKYQQDYNNNNNSSVLKNLSDKNNKDERDAGQAQVNEFSSYSTNNFGNNFTGMREYNTSGHKVYDNSAAAIDGNNYANSNSLKDPSQSEKAQFFKNNQQNEQKLGKEGIENVDYYFKNGIINKQSIEGESLTKNNGNHLTTTPTKDSTRYQRSNSDYQPSKQHLIDNNDSKYLKSRSISQSKYPSLRQNSQLHYLTNSNDISQNRPDNQNSYIPNQQASFRNAADFYSVQLPESQYPYESMYGNSILSSYSAKQDSRSSFQKQIPQLKQDDLQFELFKMDTFANKTNYHDNDHDFQEKNQPYYSNNLENFRREQHFDTQYDISKDSSNLLYGMKEKQLQHERKLQEILKESYGSHNRQTNDFFIKKQQKDSEIQKQYQELQKFKQTTSHFNQNSHYDPLPDISEIKDLDHSNMSEFINKDTYDPYTPHSSAFKNQLKYPIKQTSEHPSFLKNSFMKVNNNNNNNNNSNLNLQFKNEQMDDQREDKEQKNYILEVNDSFKITNNQAENDFEQKMKHQQQELESLRKQIKEDEIDRITQKQLQKEQEKRIQYLEKEISNLTSRLKDIHNSAHKNNSDNSRKENISGSSSIQNRRLSKQDNNKNNNNNNNSNNNINNKNNINICNNSKNNNNLKIIESYGIDEEKQVFVHNCGSGMKFSDEQKFRFKITELLQVEKDEEIIQRIKQLVQYKRQNESFSHCIIDTMAQLAPQGHFKNQKPSLLESWKFIKKVIQQYVNLTTEKKRLKSLAKQLSEVITKGLDTENLDLQNSIKNILIL